jgi:fatty-acyl-CoA synthase
VASFKIPRHVVFVEELPMTSTGKVQKVKLRERARAAWPSS